MFIPESRVARKLELAFTEAFKMVTRAQSFYEAQKTKFLFSKRTLGSGL